MSSGEQSLLVTNLIVGLGILALWILKAIFYWIWLRHRGSTYSHNYVPVEIDGQIIVVDINDENITDALRSMSQPQHHVIARDLSEHTGEEEFEVKTAGTPSWETLDGPPR